MRRQTPPAFTLVELMVSVALVVILMYGVSRVFTTTQAVVSSNQAISNATRDARAAQSVFSKDFTDYAADGPCFLILNERKSAFRNAEDEAGSRTWAAAQVEASMRSIDVDGNNVEGEPGVPGEVIAPAAVNFRSHRTDTISFFTRGLFHRQTGGNMPNGDSPLIANMTGTEGWVWYGHLKLPNNPPPNTPPTFQNLAMGVVAPNTNSNSPPLTRATNPNNWYSTQWILGREQMICREKGSDGTIRDKTNQSQMFVDAPAIPPSGLVGVLAPLAHDSATNVPGFTAAASRVDLAATSISDYRTRIATYVRRAAPNSPWWDSIFCSPGVRFQSNPFLLKPVTPEALSQQAPILLRSCTSFTVEYAGDFLVQDRSERLPNGAINPNYGQVTDTYEHAGQGDGAIDFIAIPPPAGSPPGTTASRVIRWYGLPRDSNGDGSISITAANPSTITDVVPLRDVWRLYTGTGATPNAPFERFTWPAHPTQTMKDYGVGGTGNYLAPSGAGLGPDDYYLCAFGASDPKPKMIRLTLTIDDPQGRTPDGQTFEYVFTLP